MLFIVLFVVIIVDIYSILCRSTFFIFILFLVGQGVLSFLKQYLGAIERARKHESIKKVKRVLALTRHIFQLPKRESSAFPRNLNFFEGLRRLFKKSDKSAVVRYLVS